MSRDAKPSLYARRRKRVSPQPLPARPVSAPSRSSRKAEGEALELGGDLTMATRLVTGLLSRSVLVGKQPRQIGIGQLLTQMRP